MIMTTWRALTRCTVGIFRVDMSGARNWFGMDLAWCRRRRAPNVNTTRHAAGKAWKVAWKIGVACRLPFVWFTLRPRKWRAHADARCMHAQWAFNCTQPNKSSSSLSAAKSFFSYISNLHKYFPSSTFVFNLPHKHLYLYHNAPVCNFITKRLQSHLQA